MLEQGLCSRRIDLQINWTRFLNYGAISVITQITQCTWTDHTRALKRERGCQQLTLRWPWRKCRAGIANRRCREIRHSPEFIHLQINKQTNDSKLFNSRTNRNYLNKKLRTVNKTKLTDQHTQVGAFPEGPSHPICATCLTSVGYPISISRSFTTSKTMFFLFNNKKKPKA